ncbi:MAG: hypothetical protein AB2L14_14980 [Candidatus Xenobiia bacterium LiM19]
MMPPLQIMHGYPSINAFTFSSHLGPSKKHLACTLMPLILPLWILTLPLCYIIDDRRLQDDPEAATEIN